MIQESGKCPDLSMPNLTTDGAVLSSVPRKTCRTMRASSAKCHLIVEKGVQPFPYASSTSVSVPAQRVHCDTPLAQVVRRLAMSVQ